VPVRSTAVGTLSEAIYLLLPTDLLTADPLKFSFYAASFAGWPNLQAAR